MDKEIVKLLIDEGADVNHRDRKGRTPLFDALYIINQDIVVLLIEEGANVNVQDNDGIVPPILLKNYKYHTQERLVIMHLLKKYGRKE